MNKYATYLRVSTQKQGASGLGLESQRKICGDFIKVQDGVLLKEFLDVESGTHRDRKGLQQAISFCKQNDCALVIAKLDRLCRDVEFCFKVVNTGIEIHFCDMPSINTLLLGVFASVAQYERELTSDRTKKALAAKKARGEKLGGASEKWKFAMCSKSGQDLQDETSRRGLTRVLRHLQNRDTAVFVKILQRVFPLYCQGEPETWTEWREINTKGENKYAILNLMKDYQELDENGATFRKWDFSDITSKKMQQKLGAYIQTLRKSVTKKIELAKK